MCVATQEFWVVRPADQWSPAEIKEMVTSSPWATLATVRAASGAGAVAVAGGVLVRWESAAPIVDACSIGGMERHLFSCASKLLYVSGLSEKFNGLRNACYILGLSNYPKPPRTASDPPEHSDAANAALERMSRGIQETAFLSVKGKRPIPALQVVSLPAGDALLLMIFFPRSETLSLEDGVVRFNAAGGTLTLEATFDLRKMPYQGNLAL